LSGTEKTTPWKIRAATDHELAVPVHNHLTGPCDLPDSPATSEVTNCIWRPSPRAVFGNNHIPVVDKFTTALERRRRTRDTRREAHREEHEITRATLVGLHPDELDDVL